MKTKFLTAAFLCFTVFAWSQYGDRDANRIGIIGGVNQMTLSTKNFNTKAQTGWNVGLSLRGNFYNDFDMVYAMQFSETKFSVPTRNILLQKEDVAYKLPAAQISLMLSYKIVENHLSIEAGPVFQINDKLKIDDDDNTANVIEGADLKDDGTALRAGDILKVSQFSFYPAVGITAGIRHVRLNVQYLVGVTNLLGKLNDSNNAMSGFKGNAGILNGNLIIYL
jgi:hypothetical protein